MSSQHKILALDFDGVIADSIKECLVSGFNAYANFTENENIERYNQLDPAWAAEARRLRNYIRNGEDYVYIAHALANDVTVDTQQDFDAFLKKHAHLRDEFFDHMYNQRIFFSDAKPDLWAALNPLYDGMRDFLINYPDKDNLYIITTKKLVFVYKILSANKINLLEENIRDTSGGLTKRQIIEEISQKRNAGSKDFYFIDDQVDTLIKILPSGVNVFFAEWGYNTPEQADVARTNSIPVVTLNGFYDQFNLKI